MKYIELRDVLGRFGRANGLETQAAIARRLGMSAASLSQKLKGERSFTCDELHEMAGMLGTSMDVVYLLID